MIDGFVSWLGAITSNPKIENHLPTNSTLQSTLTSITPLKSYSYVKGKWEGFIYFLSVLFLAAWNGAQGFACANHGLPVSYTPRLWFVFQP